MNITTRVIIQSILSTNINQFMFIIQMRFRHKRFVALNIAVAK